MLTAAEPLSQTHPELSAIWHPTKNGKRSPDNISKEFTAVVWFQCRLGHEWKRSPALSKNAECPVCLARSNSLAALWPKVANEWHPTRNGNLTAYDLSPGSAKIVWWQCGKDQTHEWQTAPGCRTGTHSSGCPYCRRKKVDAKNNLAVLRPDLVAQWHPTKNGLNKPMDFLSGSSKKAWWLCPVNPSHEWQTKITARSLRNRGCPYCSNYKINDENSLLALFPALAEEWHPHKNGTLAPTEVVPGSHKKVWWLCGKTQRHEWQAEVRTRAHGGHGCPTCSFNRATPENCLAARFPEIAAEWHPTKNGKVWDDWLPKEMQTSISGKLPPKNRKMTPADVSYGSALSVWWQCPKSKSHVWEAPVCHRTTNGSGCPFCVGRNVSDDNNLAAKFPAVAKHWHPTRNAPLLPTEVTHGLHTKVWWLCFRNADHNWQAKIYIMVLAWQSGRSGCPTCLKETAILGGNLLLKYPEVAILWHPYLNKSVMPAQVMAGSNKKFWWTCTKNVNHEWLATANKMVTARLKNTKGCPFCSGKRTAPDGKVEIAK